MIPSNKQSWLAMLIILIFVVVIDWLDVKLPTSQYAQKKQDRFLQMVHVVLINDPNIKIEKSGKNISGLIFVSYTNGQSFDSSVITPIPDYVNKLKSFGYKQLLNKTATFCNEDEMLEFQTVTEKNSWLLVWSYPSDECKEIMNHTSAIKKDSS